MRLICLHGPVYSLVRSSTLTYSITSALGLRGSTLIFSMSASVGFAILPTFTNMPELFSWECTGISFRSTLSHCIRIGRLARVHDPFSYGSPRI